MSSIPSTQSYTINLQPRRFLLHNPLYKPPSQQNPIPGASDRYTPDSGTQPGNSFDANVVMILAVLLCALICALGLNSIVRCALRCSSQVSGSDHETTNSITRLAQTRLRRKVLQSMPILIYSTNIKLNATNPVCAICLSDFEPGERVRVLPKCNHGFHVRCIDRWLMARSSCPTCRRCLFGSQQKTSGCGGPNMMEEPTRQILVPLEREGLATRHGL